MPENKMNPRSHHAIAPANTNSCRHSANPPCLPPELNELRTLFDEVRFGSIRLHQRGRSSQLRIALEELEAEGLIRVLTNNDKHISQPLLMATAAVPFDILEYRIRDEFELPVCIEALPYCHARLIGGEPREIVRMARPLRGFLRVRDSLGRTIGLFSSEADIASCERDNPHLTFAAFD